VIEHVVAFQFLCGGFAAFVAGRKRRSPVAWFAVGTLVPAVGVALALRVSPRPARRAGTSSDTRREVRSWRRPPRRCRGYYIPDCRGCPYFSTPLFDPSYGETRKGHCGLFNRELVEQVPRPGQRVTVEE